MRLGASDMGFIEEGCQLFQDFVAPEIRAIDARLTAVERRLESLETKLDRVDAKVDRVQQSLEAKMDRNHAEVMDALRRMENYSLLAERLARVEAKLQNVA
jgi:tetrahydromethanopterin S-methyltransferase subunit G